MVSSKKSHKGLYFAKTFQVSPLPQWIIDTISRLSYPSLWVLYFEQRMALVFFLPGGSVISGDIEGIHICYMQTHHWCPTSLCAEYFSVLPLSVSTLLVSSYPHMDFHTAKFPFPPSGTHVSVWISALSGGHGRWCHSSSAETTTQHDLNGKLSDLTICHFTHPWGNHGQPTLLVASHYY